MQDSLQPSNSFIPLCSFSLSNSTQACDFSCIVGNWSSFRLLSAGLAWCRQSDIRLPIQDGHGQPDREPLSTQSTPIQPGQSQHSAPYMGILVQSASRYARNQTFAKTYVQTHRTPKMLKALYFFVPDLLL